MMNTNKFIAVAFALFLSLVSYAQEITVTVEKQVPATVHSLDFVTVLDEASVIAFKEEGLNVDVKSTLLSSGSSKYNCTISSVTKKAYDKLDARWRVQLSGAEIGNAKVENQEKYLTEVYSTLLNEARSKAKPMAMAMEKKLGNLESMELLKYDAIGKVSADDPFSGYVFASMEVDFSCR